MPAEMIERIALCVPSLQGGGAERAFLHLAKGLTQLGWWVDVVVVSQRVAYQVPKHDRLRLISLDSERVSHSVLRLREYIMSQRPCTIISALSHMNIAVIMSTLLTTYKPPIIITEHNNFRLNTRYAVNYRARLMPWLMRLLYPLADRVVAVSQALSEDLKRFVPKIKDKVHVIYNPVIDDEIFARSQEAIDHPWFRRKTHKVVISVGRLVEQKDHATLLRAFNLVRRKVQAKLVILGEGPKRVDLEKLVRDLELQEAVCLAGFVENPYKFVKAADAFVLSSRWEGLSIVLVEALALGTPIISTDCPHGPSEILAQGRYGKLVSVGDVTGMADALVETLTAPPPPCGETAWSQFTIQSATRRYARLISDVISSGR